MNPPQEKNFEFYIARTFDAPRDIVWKAWTNETQLQQWFGPKGCDIIASKLDLRPGGTYLYGMKMPGGVEMWGRWIFREIAPPEKLVFIVSFSDATGTQITRHPFSPQWPLTILSTVSFHAKGDKTEVVVQWQALDATAEETKTFEDGQPSMQQGWGGTFERFDAFLSGPGE